MRAALVLAALALAACGGPEVETTDDALLVQQQQAIGRYEFGPLVGKGLPPADGEPYPLSRLPTLQLHPDGTFEMTHGAGCIMGFASGTWTARPSGELRLDVGVQNEWTDAPQQFPALRVTTLTATREDGGLRIVGQSDTGRALSQLWTAVAP